MATPDPLLETVRAATAGEFDVYGELGREGPGDIWFLARELATQGLVALRAHATGVGPDGKPEYDLDVAKELDATVAVGMGDCRSCGSPVRRWAKFCTKCGKDLGLGGNLPASPAERAALLAEVKVAAGDQYEFYGEMPWVGGGIVYFARELSSGRIVRLRLKAADDGYELGETKVMPRLADRLSASYVTHDFPAQPGKQPRLEPVEPRPGGVAPPEPTLGQPAPTEGAVSRVNLFGREVDLRTLIGIAAVLIVIQAIAILTLLMR